MSNNSSTYLTEGDIGLYNFRVVNIDTYSCFTPYFLMFWPQRTKDVNRDVLSVNNWRISERF